MLDQAALSLETTRSLNRLLPNIEDRFAGRMAPGEWDAFAERLHRHFPDLFRLLLGLYGGRYDFFYHLEQTVALAAQSWIDRPADLKELDEARDADPLWFQSETMLGGVCYVDLFAGDLTGLFDKIPYFRELGLTYLHLMPLFDAPEGENDGGYAVSDYRQVEPSLGTMADLQRLARALRDEGISLVLDFVFNHTSDEHRWAQKAQAGDPDYADYYFLFPDRQTPDAYDQTLREIFPETRRGCFTYRAEIDRWVWTTFNSFQWDLNYANPAVFRDMAGEMLFLANAGAEALRLDALAFTWKQMGTNSENLPQAHQLVQAFNALLRIAAPAMLFKSEAIVHPDEVAKYIGRGECQLSYNPLLMALLWNSLATREVRLLRHSMGYRFRIPDDCAWVNYVRCHDDIGWTFDDGDAAALGINGYDHRRFLNEFYTGRFAGSFARGLPFQENPRTGDARISGSLASLAGLERALLAGNEAEIELAVRRICLLHAVILSIGGIPLIYLGDEFGVINDYGYRDDPAKADDSRWVHRPRIDWEEAEKRHQRDTLQGRIYSRLQHLIAVRKGTAAFAGGRMEVVDVGNDHVFGYVRSAPAGEGAQRVLALANFTETVQAIDANEVRLYGLGYRFTDLVAEKEITLGEGEVALEPYQVMWLLARDER
ncbi:MAG: alpha-amylase family protein [Chloroflexota bacterium]|nr:alpha-amylase family protein [Chloroflexota bacterium]